MRIMLIIIIIVFCSPFEIAFLKDHLTFAKHSRQTEVRYELTHPLKQTVALGFGAIGLVVLWD